MKKLIGTLIICMAVVLNCTTVFADDNLKDNLRLNVNQNNQSAINVNNNTNKNETYNIVKQNIVEDNSLNFEITPVKTFQVMPDGIIYQELQRNYNAIDPKKEGNVNSYYPGLRGPNQLNIYTPLYGLRTGTNEFGTEAIVENNMVVRMNGADSIIPRNGFVISGHGSAKNWINKNIQIGSKVYIDYSLGAIRIYLTPESLIFAAKEKLTEVNNLIDYYKKIDILYNDKKAGELMESSKEALRKAEKKPEKTQSYINEAMDSLNLAIKNAIPYYENELKGVWIRPVEKTPEAIVKTVERIANTGITDIFLETYFHGKTIYPSEYLRKYGVIPQREEFAGFDPLEVWIKEAHKRNIKVHIWFETFYVGNDNPQNNSNHVLRVYPLWANKRLSDYDAVYPVPSLSEHNGYFLDPANMQVQVYLLGLIDEIITKYKPDGINLDYIRYPQTVDSSFSNYAQTNWGYTVIARNEFKSLYNIDPIDIKYATPEWDMWALYRQNRISDFVKKVHSLTEPANVTLTAVIFPDLKKSITTKMQNWRLWAVNGYIDGLTPLILTGDKNTANLLLNDVIKNTGNCVKIYPGLFVTFIGGTFDELLVQIHKAREFKTKGTILFDYAHLSDVYIDALKTRVFNKTYDNNKEFKLKQPSEDYKPEVKLKDNKKKKKHFRRKKSD